jgi:hypothetical protein
LRDLLRLHPDLQEMGGVVAGTEVLTEARGPRLRWRPAEGLAVGDAVLGWGRDGPGFYGQTVESVRSRDAPPLLVEVRADDWKVIVAPHQLIQVYIWAADVLEDFRRVDANLDGRPLSLKSGAPFVEPRLIWAPAARLGSYGVWPRILQQDGGRYAPEIERPWPMSYFEVGTPPYAAACPDGKLYLPEVGPGGVFIANGFFLRDARPFSAAPPTAPAAEGQT